jgi:hypothetical protein
VADQDSLPAVPFEHFACLVQVRRVQEFEPFEPLDQSTQAISADPEP